MGLISFLLGSESRSIENPSISLSSPEFYDAVGATKSSSGIRVSSETALSYSPIWKGINLIAGDIGKLATHVDKLDADGRRHAIKHPAYNLLRHKPNSEMTASVWKKTMQGHALMEGNGYSYIWRNGAGDPVELTILNPHQVTPVRYNGVLWYVYKFEDGTQRKLPACDVIHIKGFSFDGLIGYNLIHKAKESLGWAMALQTYGSVFFRNGAVPKVILEHPGRLQKGAAENLVKSWERLQGGLENAHRTAVLEEGMKAHILSANAEDTQLIEQMKFSYVDVANWLQLPPHKVGGEGRTAYASLEQENQAYLDDCLDGWLVTWEEECRDKLLTEQEKQEGSHEVRFNRRDLLRADLTARSSFYVQMLNWGVLSPDEVRHEEGANPQDGGIGKYYYRPGNMALIGADGVIKPVLSATPGAANPEPAPTPVEDKSRSLILAAVRKMIADTVRRMAIRVGTQAERAAADRKVWGVWIDQLEASNGETIRDACDPSETAAVAMGGQAGLASWLVDELRNSFNALGDECTPAQLPGGAAALAKRLANNLPEQAVDKFLGGVA